MGMIHQDLKKRSSHRLKIVKGQVEGLIKAVEKEEYCIDLLRQSLSIQKALESFDQLILENHLRVHVKDQLSGKEMGKAIKELLEIYNLSNRK